LEEDCVLAAQGEGDRDRIGTSAQKMGDTKAHLGSLDNPALKDSEALRLAKDLKKVTRINPFFHKFIITW
jgi:hypothetical protein